MQQGSNKVVIYVMGDERKYNAKYGFTHDLDARKPQHERRGPDNEPMLILAALWGTEQDEQAIKDYYQPLGLLKNSPPGGGGKGLRRRADSTTEWFSDPRDPRVMRWIQTLRTKSYVLVPEDDKSYMEQMRQLPYHQDSSDWLPGSIILRYVQDDLFSGVLDDSRPWSELPQKLPPSDGDYYTPVEYSAAIRATYGEPPDLDPATCNQANNDSYGRGIHARRIYDQLEDGLVKPWFGKVWLNPPFGQWDKWVQKITDELDRGDVTELMVYCTISALTNKSHKPLFQRYSALMISHGRPNCWGPRATTAPDGIAVLYFGPHPDRFGECWAHLGQILRPA